MLHLLVSAWGQFLSTVLRVLDYPQYFVHKGSVYLAFKLTIRKTIMYAKVQIESPFLIGLATAHYCQIIRPTNLSQQC